MDRICSIQDCERKVFGHDWCNAHYSAWRRHGDPLWVRTPPAHGTFTRYQSPRWPCHCDDCTSAYRRYASAVARKRRLDRAGEGDLIPGVEWRVLSGSGLYRVSNAGHMQSLRFGYWKNLKGHLNPQGYWSVLVDDRKHQRVHRLVLEAFVGPSPEDKPFWLHKNGDPGDNRLENLYWGDQQENADDRRKHGRNARKLSDSDADDIRNSPLSSVDSGKKYGVHPMHINLIRRNGTWKG